MYKSQITYSPFGRTRTKPVESMLGEQRETIERYIKGIFKRKFIAEIDINNNTLDFLAINTLSRGCNELWLNGRSVKNQPRLKLVLEFPNEAEKS